MSADASNHARIPILYVILGVLLIISIIPMYFYSAQVEAINRDRLKTNEMLLQNTVTRSLADDLSQHERSLRMMLANLSSAIQVASGGDIGEKTSKLPELRACLKTSSLPPTRSPMPAFFLLNSDAKGISAGRIAPDAFLQRRAQNEPLRPRAMGAPTTVRPWSSAKVLLPVLFFSLVLRCVTDNAFWA